MTTTRSVAIAAVGAAAPSLRLTVSDVNAAWGRPGGRGQVAVCAADEDTLTLAWEAADAALAAAGVGADAVDGLWWATSRPPFAEGPSHAYLAATLRLPTRCGGALLAGSVHAGMEALLAAWDAVLAGSAGTALVIASDALMPGTGTGIEVASGAGAAALVLTAGDGPAALVARSTASRPVLDRYRGDDEDETREAYDPRLFREQVFLPAVTEVGRELVDAMEGTDGARWSLPDPDGRLGSAAARALHAGPVASTAARAELGDTGAAGALLGAAGSLAEAGNVVLLGYGAGRTTGVLIRVDAPVPGADAVPRRLAEGRKAGYAEVLRARRRLVAAGDKVEMAVPPGSAMFVRGNPEMLGLLGARCVACGTINTPPTIHPACVSCGADKFDIVALARRGEVHTFVVNHTMPAPFEAPLPLAVIDLVDGARVMLQTTGDDSRLAIGSSVALCLRRYTTERGVPVYGYKARVLDSDDEQQQQSEEVPR